jgi:tetratricopeptide (TPR) repeat protein
MLFLVLLSFMAWPAVQTQAATNLLVESDTLYEQREQREQLMKAIEGYEAILAQNPNDFETACKLAKAYWYRGNHSAPEEKKEFFEKGVAAGEKAVAISPERCEGHFWLGTNIAMDAEFSGAFTALGLIDDIKKELHESMKIDENCECGGPSRVLGKLYTRIPWFKGGSKSKAIDYLKKSLELCPNDTQSRIFLAEIYIDESKNDLAIEQLNQVLKQDPDPEWIPEIKENKIIAAKMLRELQQP